jgi:hypothetical protein
LLAVWFKDIDPQKVDAGEAARGLAICYTTADFAKKLSGLPKEEVLHRVVDQLDTVFSLLEERHMTAAPPTPSSPLSTATTPTSSETSTSPKLKKPSEAYLGGMFWDWNAQHYPYITGGYCSPRAGKNAQSIKVLAEPYSHTEEASSSNSGTAVVAERVFFAGEATSVTAGSTAHAAMASGIRAAAQVAKKIQLERNA